MNDWNDLKFFLAVAHNGTVSGAARLLGVNYTTVIRRLNSFEDAMGFAVFDRQSNGYQLTRAGQLVLSSTQSIEDEFVSLSNLAVGIDTDIAGTVRIATTDLLAATLMPDISQCLQQYPDIDIEIISDSVNVDLTNREADIAIRITNQAPDEHFLSRKVGRVSGAIYASTHYLDSLLPNTDNSTQTHRWISWDNAQNQIATNHFLSDYLPENAKIACKVNSGCSLLHAIQAGIGIGYLWCFIGDSDQNLQRLYPENVRSMNLWLVINKDLYSTPRFKTVMNFLENAIQARDLFQRVEPLTK